MAVATAESAEEEMARLQQEEAELRAGHQSLEREKLRKAAEG